MRFHEIVSDTALPRHANPNVMTVYHGDTKPNVTVHPKMFFTSDPDFAKSYGSYVTAYHLNISNFADTLDPDLIEEFLPFYDSYDDKEVETLDDYMERSSDTWEMIEADGKADSMVGRVGAAGLIVYEGGVRNFLVYDTSVVKPIVTEEWHNHVRGMFGHFDVFRNPTRSELLKLLRQWGNQTGRACIDKQGNLFVWDSEAGGHDEAQASIPDLEMMSLFVERNHVIFSELEAFRDGPEEQYDAGLRVWCGRLWNSPGLKRLYGGKVPLVGFDEEGHDTYFEITPEWINQNVKD
jgi:hypothetical protein